MEAIKISVEVSVNLSENTQNFIKSLFNVAAYQCASQKPAPVPVAPVKVEEKKPAPVPVASVKVEEKKPAPVPVAPASSSKTIEDVRAELAKKVNDHRDKIKNKLTELGAPSVTKLDPSKYDEMYNFLVNL